MNHFFSKWRRARKSWRSVAAPDLQRGSAMLELTLIIPILIWIPLGVLEFSRVLQLAQVAQVLTREAGSHTFRICADFQEQNLALTMQRTSACVEKLLNDETSGVQAFADSITEPGTISIVVSVFRAGLAGGPPQLLSRTGELPAKGRTSKFNVVGTKIVGPTTLAATTIESRERILVAEVYHRYEPLIVLIPGLGTALTNEGDYYFRAIY